MKKFYFVFLLFFFIASCGGSDEESTAQATVSTGFNKGIKSFQLTSSENVVYTSEVTVTVSVEFTKKTSQPAILTLSLNGSTILTEEISVSNGTDYNETLKVPLEKGSNIIVVKIQYLDSVVSDFVTVNYVDSSLADFMGSINITSTGYRVFYLYDGIHAKVTDVTISYNTTLPISVESIEISLDQGENWIPVRDYFSEKSQGSGYYADYITFSHVDIGKFKPIIKVTGKVNVSDFSIIDSVNIEGDILPKVGNNPNFSPLYKGKENKLTISGWFGKDPWKHYGYSVIRVYNDVNHEFMTELYLDKGTERVMNFHFTAPSNPNLNCPCYVRVILSLNGINIVWDSYYFEME